jgi:hypothetical protein
VSGGAGTADPREGRTPLERRALLRVVRGEPTAEELAALVAVVTARPATAGEPSAPVPASAWRDRSAVMRTALPHGPHGWRASAWPR